MSLLNLKTDLKSLKYGNDQPGGGNSGQPYIQTAIPESRTTPFTSGLIKSSLTDTKRIFKFLKDIPQGPLFIIKQVGLQLSNPRLEVKKKVNLGDILTGDVSSLTTGLLQPTRLYNLGINTLAQIPVSGFGGHLNRHGLLPVQDDNTKYLAVAQANNENSKNNRLVGYKTKFSLGDGKTNDALSLPKTGILGALLNALPFKFAPKDLTIDNYIGGPGSVFGIGNTLIRRYDNTEDASKINAAKEKSFFTAGRVHNFVNNDIKSLDPNVDIAKSSNSISGQLKVADSSNISVIPTSSTAKTYAQVKKNIEAQIKNYGADNLYGDVNLSINNNRGAKDFKYFGTKKVFDSGSVAIYNNTLEFERYDADIMTVGFQAINSINPLSGKGEEWLFSAYMKGFKDNFNATWNDVNYVGRSESFYIYNKFNREVTFNLDIPCFNKQQLFEKHRALGQLASTTAGTYNNGLLGGVILKVKVGKYLNNEYAILKSLNYDIPDDSSWDIDEQLAMCIKVSFSFTIIHKKLPQYEVGSNDSETGFFGYIKDDIPGYLPSDYKKLYATKTPPTAPLPASPKMNIPETSISQRNRLLEQRVEASGKINDREFRNKVYSNQFLDAYGNFRTN